MALDACRSDVAAPDVCTSDDAVASEPLLVCELEGIPVADDSGEPPLLLGRLDWLVCELATPELLLLLGLSVSEAAEVALLACSTEPSLVVLLGPRLALGEVCEPAVLKLAVLVSETEDPVVSPASEVLDRAPVACEVEEPAELGCPRAPLASEVLGSD